MFTGKISKANTRRNNLAGLILIFLGFTLLVDPRVSSAQEVWAFWAGHRGGGGVTAEFFNEGYISEEQCRDAQLRWIQQQGLQPILFTCASVDAHLLQYAEGKCSDTKREHYCLWAQDIRRLLGH